MEHPLMLLSYFLDKIGLGNFAYNNPHVVYTWLFILVLILISRLATANISMVPGVFQNIAEVIIDTLENFQESIMGKEGRSFFPLMATLMIFVAFSNFQGVIPGSYAPTANINTTASLAIIIFLLTHYVGIKKYGTSYIKHFCGPVKALTPLMLPVELLSHVSRLLSLTLRLFGNVMGEELVVIVLFFLGGSFLFFLPLPMMALGLLTGFLQAFIITLLAMIYISGSIEEAH